MLHGPHLKNDQATFLGDLPLLQNSDGERQRKLSQGQQYTRPEHTRTTQAGCDHDRIARWLSPCHVLLSCLLFDNLYGRVCLRKSPHLGCRFAIRQVPWNRASKAILRVSIMHDSGASRPGWVLRPFRATVVGQRCRPSAAKQRQKPCLNDDGSRPSHRIRYALSSSRFCRSMIDRRYVYTVVAFLDGVSTSWAS